MSQDAGKYMWTALSVSFGSVLVLGCSYIFSRIKEKQEIEERLNRIEEIIEELEIKEKGKSID